MKGKKKRQKPKEGQGDRITRISATVTEDAAWMLQELAEGVPFRGNESLTIEDLIRGAYAIRVGTNVKMKGGVITQKKRKFKPVPKDRLHKV